MTDDRDRQGHDEDTGKVVRLPRDWLGPREELVPIGPEPCEPERAGSAEILELSPRPGRGDATACTQDDFWGGDLDAIPKPVIAPRPEQTAPAAPRSTQAAPVAGHDHVAPGALGLRVGRHPAMPRRRSGRRAEAPPASPRRSLRCAAPSRRLATMAGLAAAVLGAIAGVAGLGGHPSRPARLAPAAHTRLANVPEIPQTLDPHPIPVSRARAPVASPHRSQAKRPRRQVSATVATFVKTYTTRALPSTASSSSSAAAATPTSTSAPVTVHPTAAPSTSSPAATTASPHKPRSGPSGPGAPFAPGQLG